MNKQPLPFWLRFGVFLIIFSTAFFFILFIIEKPPYENFKQMMIKIGILATMSSLLYNYLLESGREVTDLDKDL